LASTFPGRAIAPFSVEAIPEFTTFHGGTATLVTLVFRQ
jgi:hypothetical protein